MTQEIRKKGKIPGIYSSHVSKTHGCKFVAIVNLYACCVLNQYMWGKIMGSADACKGLSADVALWYSDWNDVTSFTNFERYVVFARSPLRIREVPIHF